MYAIGVIPNGPYKNGPGNVNVPITCGGILVRPGDILVGDADGVIVIPPEEAEAIADATEKVEIMEAGIVKEIREQGTYTRPWVESKLAALGTEII